MNLIPQESRPEIGAILPLRKRYDTFVNLRPIILPKQLIKFSPLKPELIRNGLNILMIRELVGGIYFGQKTEGETVDMQFAMDECVYTRKEIERVAQVAFQEARKRKTQLTNIHKANILATSRFWNHIVEEVGSEFKDVPYKSMLVDNAAYQLVKKPEIFNGVVLLENMQGDILSDQAGGILGSLGLMPSACIGPKKGYVEPAHGSAPDIAGKNIANPYSMIGSIALMLECLFGLNDEAKDIYNALYGVFEAGYTTSELDGESFSKDKILSTSDFGDLVVKNIG